MLLDGFTVSCRPDGSDAVPAIVPGGVHESLLAAGRIAHPYADRNELAARWVEDETWTYRASVALPGDLGADERLRLVFDGLDSVATVAFDGQLLGRHASMFTPAEFDVTALAGRTGTLTVEFAPPLAGLGTPPVVADTAARLRALFAAVGAGGGDEDAGGVLGADPALTRRRKATMSWGWDLGPRLPSIGIWRPVRLLRERGAVLAGHHVRALAVDPATGSARVAIDVEVDAFAASGPLRTAVELVGPDGVAHRVEPVDGHAEIELVGAALWWTHDLGRPDRYAVTITLSDASGAVLDTATDRVGLRTVTLDRTPDPDGTGRSFRFVLNGVPVFARGACWVPPSTMIGSVPAEHYARLVDLARAANMTMLRVWGGGVYEHDAFYAACDEAGVLVWQDFMFACTDYPGDEPELRAAVTAEADHQVRRLSNRACLALWCGNNEVHAVHVMAHGDVAPTVPDWGWSLFHEVLPAAVAAHAPQVPYWPGSPYSELSEIGSVNNVTDGDRHAWEVWHGFDLGAGPVPEGTGPGMARHFTRYAADRGRFISEFGLHAYPDMATLRRWLPADQLYPHSPAVDHHNKDNPKDKGDELLAVETGLPPDRSLAATVELTQAVQAEGLKFGIEHYRRQEPHTAGTLVWQFDDCWPGLTWSIVDHDLVPKAGYHAVARAYAPVAASVARADGGLAVWLANSGRAPVRTVLRVDTTDLRGTPVRTDRFPVAVAPGSAVCAGELPDVTEPDRVVLVVDEGGHAPDNRWFPCALKDLPLPTDPLDVVVADRADGSTEVTVTARAFAYAVRVHADGAVPDRDFVDLPAGRSVVVTLRGRVAGAGVRADHYAQRLAGVLT